MRPFALVSLVIVLAACGAPETSDAQDRPIEAPAWVAVDNVASDDVLNIRADADAGSEIVGTLAPGAGPIEIAATRQIGEARWGLVAIQEGSGWINLAYASPAEVTMIGDSPIPAGTICAGTEPFWSLELTGEAGIYSDFEIERETYEISESESARSRPWPWMFGLRGSGLALLTPELCSDGMSDLPYAWSILLIRHDQTGHALYEGCCRLRSPDTDE
ncbi:COG3650 family protein [Hyphobacterium marinum]|uniref:SH3b domain-containing protein n=1 Tax=Hyphobacterium marinum TaxID=3116574 RepID=A0ABU7M034_9PROT|nr:hypothetical protein [Hyphobacterium sp. Y6023]MEE2567156.1 hypothetical protein [Hyphobacterium sp. Y6023]